MMRKTVEVILVALLFFFLFVPKSNAGEALKNHEAEPIGEIVAVSKFAPVEGALVMGVLVIRQDDKEIEILYKGERTYKVGEKVIFKDGKVEPLE